MKTILQIPIDKGLRDEAVKRAKEDGFSSLQELIRFFLAKLAEGKVDFNIIIR